MAQSLRELQSGPDPLALFYSSVGQTAAANEIRESLAARIELVVVTGEDGTGKTFLLRRIVKTLPADSLPIFVHYCPSSVDDLVDYVIGTLNPRYRLFLNHHSGRKKMEGLQRYFRQRQRREQSNVVFIDDSHNLSEPVLRAIFLLAYPRETGAPLIQLALIGLPALNEVLQRSSLKDLMPRSRADIEVPPLKEEEVNEYILLKYEPSYRFTPEAITKLITYSHRIPRLINMLCEYSIVIARSTNARIATAGMVDEAARTCEFALVLHRKEATAEGVIENSRSEVGVPGAVLSVSANSSHHSSNKLFNNISNNTTICSLPEQERPMYRTESINKVLKTLQSGSPDVEAAALISEDGLMIASVLPQDLDETRVAGMSATLLSLGTRAAVELRRGDVREVVVRGEQGYSVMVNAGRGVLLLVVANENAKLGLIFFDMREAANALRQIL